VLENSNVSLSEHNLRIDSFRFLMLTELNGDKRRFRQENPKTYEIQLCFKTRVAVVSLNTSKFVFIY